MAVSNLWYPTSELIPFHHHNTVIQEREQERKNMKNERKMIIMIKQTEIKS